MERATLGVDLGIRANHVATLCNERGERVWSKRRFRNRHDELEALVGHIGECGGLTVVMDRTVSVGRFLGHGPYFESARASRRAVP